jgi:hypothetical protein
VWYQINEFPSGIGACVFKLIYGDRYVIIKCKTLVRAVENINVGLKYFFKNTPKGRNPNDIYFKFYSFVADNPFKSFIVEPFFISENPYELLKTEHIALETAKQDYLCLNSSFEVYIPQFTQVNGKKSWINRGYYLNFKEWVRNRAATQNKTA